MGLFKNNNIEQEMEEVFMAFERNFKNFDDLERAPLFEKLKNDILINKAAKKVFPAIRKNEIHFYYKGGRLFKFSGKSFTTHLKYAFVCKDDEKNRDVTMSVLKDIKVADFTQGYKRIKERCALYNKGLESFFVSKLFKKYSYVTSKEDVVLLDIEAALTRENRADMVLYDKKKQIIKFVEAKLFSNGELKSSKKTETVPNEEITPKKVTDKSVIDQIERYEGKIAEKEKEIKEAYKNYIDVVNKLFGLKLPNNEIKISKKVGLIFFDFNGNDVSSQAIEKKKKELLSSEYKIDERNIYAVGDTNNASLWQLLRCNGLEEKEE